MGMKRYGESERNIEVVAISRHTATTGAVVGKGDTYLVSLREFVDLTQKRLVRALEVDPFASASVKEIKTKEAIPEVEDEPVAVVEIESKDEPSPEVAPKPKRGRPRKVR